MATHSSVLAWRIPGTGEPDGLPSMGVTQGRTRLSNFPFTFHFHALEYPRDREAWWTAVYGGRTDSDMSEVT